MVFNQSRFQTRRRSRAARIEKAYSTLLVGRMPLVPTSFSTLPLSLVALVAISRVVGLLITQTDTRHIRSLGEPSQQRTRKHKRKTLLGPVPATTKIIRVLSVS